MKKIVISAVLSSFMSCTFFEKDERFIQTVYSPNGNVVKLYYVGLGATTNDVIQIRKVNNGNDETVVKAYEHNIVNSAKFITKDSLPLNIIRYRCIWSK
jgi:hypothetical protein